MQELFFPPLEPRTSLDAPITEVTLLEDRAQVQRRVQLTLEPGTHKLRVMGVAPVLQDVSVRAEVLDGQGRATDARVRRAMRVRRQDAPDKVRELDAKLEELEADMNELFGVQQAALGRHRRLLDMLRRSVVEVPEDASWGQIEPHIWQETFEGIFERMRDVQQTYLKRCWTQQDLKEEHDRTFTQRALLEETTERFVACVDIDLTVTEAGPITLRIDYVCPNALWRPIHQARLIDGRLHFQAQAALWQHTGEDWSEVSLVFSTARSTSRTEPPVLQDDALTTRRRNEDVRFEAREVAIQTSAPSGSKGAAKPAPATERLMGVDDGGEIQNLRAQTPQTVASDGRPCFIPLFDFESDAKTHLLAFPEASLRVFLESLQHNGSPYPILAGPVELIQKSGPVGWTEVLFVAPGAPFELSFGPQDGLRLQRLIHEGKAKTDDVDKWTRRKHTVRLFLSNLEAQTRQLTITERVPVSEVEQVTIDVKKKRSKPAPDEIDANGMCRWTLDLEPHSHRDITLVWELGTAPGVNL